MHVLQPLHFVPLPESLKQDNFKSNEKIVEELKELRYKAKELYDLLSKYHLEHELMRMSGEEMRSFILDHAKKDEK